MPSYLPVMQYADNRSLRELMYRAYTTRAAEFGNAEWDNTPLIDEILKLRGQAARMLGFASYAELSLMPKMADSPQQVLAFLDDLAARVKPFAQRDYDELSRFAREQARARPAGGMGHRLGVGEAARASAMRSPSRRSSSTFPSTGC